MDEFTNAFNKELNSIKEAENKKEDPFRENLISIYTNEKVEIGKKIAALEEMIKAKVEIPGFNPHKEIKALKLKSDDLKISIAKLRENLKLK